MTNFSNNLITLTWYEMTVAAMVGVRRRIAVLSKGGKERFGNNGDDTWTHNIEGALGECAFAKATGRFWDFSVNTFQTQGDVGGIEVRTLSQDHYDLLIRPSDNDLRKFVLVVGKGPTFRVVGWAFGAEAKHEKWLLERGGRVAAYWMPQSELRAIDSL
jgi:hypothetical protein